MAPARRVCAVGRSAKESRGRTATTKRCDQRKKGQKGHGRRARGEVLQRRRRVLEGVWGPGVLDGKSKAGEKDEVCANLGSARTLQQLTKKRETSGVRVGRPGGGSRIQQPDTSGGHYGGRDEQKRGFQSTRERDRREITKKKPKKRHQSRHVRLVRFGQNCDSHRVHKRH